MQRVVANVRAVDPARAQTFYGDILGLELLMDMNWIRTYGSKTKMLVQGGGFEIEYGPVVEPWGVRRFFVRDPFGRLVNVLSHVDV